MAVQPRQTGLVRAVSGDAKPAFGPRVAARRVLLRSTLVAIAWIAGVSFALVDAYTMYGYLRSAMGVPAPSGGNQFMTEYGGLLMMAIPLACAAAIPIVLALVTAWRAFTAGRSDRRGQRLPAVIALARGLRLANWVRFSSIGVTALALAYSMQPVGWLFGVSRGAPGDPGAVAGSVAYLQATVVFAATGLLAWWLARTAVSAFHAAISPDGKYWWDGAAWQSVTGA